MPDLPQGVSFEDLYVYREGDNFYYIPGAPQAELSPAGEPTLSIMGTDAYGFLQLGAQWKAAPDSLERFVRHIQHTYPNVPSPVQVRLAPVSVTSMDLVLQADGGQCETLQTQTQISSIGVITALFNVSLDKKRRTAVLDALDHKHGALKVVVNASLEQPVQARFGINGDVRPILARVGAQATLDACRQAIEQALAAGTLQGTGTADPDASPTLLTAAAEMATQKAAAAVQRMAAGGGSESAAATMSTEATVRDSARVPLTREADVASWFTGGVRPRIYSTVGMTD